jgi:hypothetical protein
MKLHLVTFADGSSTRRDAAHRLATQSKETGWFASVNPLHLENLQQLSPIWFATHQPFLASQPRGLGYWIWKPFLILESLKRIAPDECLVYSDAGNEISASGAARFQDYVGLARIHDLFGFEIGEPIHQWTKGDLLNYLAIPSTSPFLALRQIWAGLLFIRHTPANLLLLSHWAELCVARNYSLVDDTPSVTPNPSTFREHRHDQSILTLLLRLSPRGCFLTDETYHAELWDKGGYLPSVPFHGFRNPTGIRRIPPPSFLPNSL